MTIEEANARALIASMSGDLDALKEALDTRRDVIRELVQSEPTHQLASRLRNAIGAGNFIGEDLRALQRRRVNLVA
jgi:hypothetical protein